MRNNLFVIMLFSMALFACQTSHPPASSKTQLPSKAQAAKALPKLSSQQVQTKIALLLPLSGSSASLGKAMMDAASLALFSAGNDNISLRFFDTGNTVSQAEIAAKQALLVHPSIVIGPVFSDATQAVAKVLSADRLNLISFSNNSDLAAPGVFLIGFTPEEQIKRVISYAATSGAIKNFFALLPGNKYGSKISDTLRETLVASPDTALIKTESYGEREGELNLAVSNIASALAGHKTTNEKPGLVIAEGGQKLENILSSLIAQGVDLNSVQLIGTGQLDDESALMYRSLRQVWFASSATKHRKMFDHVFETSYGYKLPRLATLAYDAVALSIILAETKGFSSESLKSSRGFAGIDGLFRFNNKGLVERGLAILQVTEHGFDTIDLAPERFQD